MDEMREYSGEVNDDSQDLGGNEDEADLDYNEYEAPQINLDMDLSIEQFVTHMKECNIDFKDRVIRKTQTI